MLLRRYWDTTLWGELLLLSVTAPILYLPQRFGQTVILCAVGSLAGGWFWRRWRMGVWYQRTPADWPLFLLLVVMLPIAVWAAPASIREQYAWPKALVLLWNFQLFVVIVTYVSRRRLLLKPALLAYMGVALVIALAAPPWHELAIQIARHAGNSQPGAVGVGRAFT